MKRTVKTILLATMAAACVLLPQSALAQGRGGGQGGPGGQGGRGGVGNFDPEQMRQRMMERYQEQLEASNDEWKVIQPLLEDVMAKQRDAMGGRFGGFGMMMGRPPGGQGGPGGQDQAQGQGQGRRGMRGGDANAEVEALRQALEDKNTPAAELNAKLKAVRDARKKAEAELKASRDKLRGVLTPRQEATLVLMGQLD